MLATSVTPTANIDGCLSPLAEACVPVLDCGFFYSDSVCEVFRTYEEVSLFCRKHLDRLENSARMIHIPIRQRREELMAEIRRAVAKSRSDIADPATAEVDVRHQRHTWGDARRSDSFAFWRLERTSPGGGEQTRRAAKTYTTCIADYTQQNTAARLW